MWNAVPVFAPYRSSTAGPGAVEYDAFATAKAMHELSEFDA
jgi:hypothetical protein